MEEKIIKTIIIFTLLMVPLAIGYVVFIAYDSFSRGYNFVGVLALIGLLGMGKLLISEIWPLFRKKN